MSKNTWNESTTMNIIRPISECDSHKNKVVPIPITMDFITLQAICRTRTYTLVTPLTPPQWLMIFCCSRFLWLYIFFFNSGFKIISKGITTYIIKSKNMDIRCIYVYYSCFKLCKTVKSMSFKFLPILVLTFFVT
jgi:hypothetical protein